MSKEVNENKINIGRELLKKQIFDGIILFIGMIAIFYCVKYLSFDGYDLFIVVTVVFLILMALFEYSKNAVKGPLNDIVIQASKETQDEILSIQEKNNSQKENHLLSSDKIRNTKEIVQNLKENSSLMQEMTSQTSEKAKKFLDFTNSEYSSVKTNIEKMFAIRHKIQTIAELILELSDFVQSISSTVGLVEDIAEQTNLLALNAAVEAARAGEHGKGFAVVASEIRKLADESKQATTKIISLINDIQQTANSTVLATEEGTKEIESGLELAHVISENIEQLITAMRDITNGLGKIIASSEQIGADSEVCSEYVTDISQILEDSKKITSENDSIFEKIESTTNNLKQSVL